VTPEPYALTYAYWKVERAKLHLDSLDEAVERYLHPEPGDLEPYTVTPQEQTNEDSISYRVEVNHPHVYIFLIASDALQNLRSALDHAVWSLVNLKHPNPDWTQFPIWSERPATVKSEARFMEFLRGLSASAIDYIKSLQPYNRPPTAPLNSVLLWQLNELNRIEKHRKILVRSSIHVPFQVVHRAGPADELGDIVQVPTDYGYEVTCFGRYKHLHPQIAPFVVFGEETSSITVTIDGLREIYTFVGDSVLPRLAGFAQQPG
jgi:hypothetical protein